MTAPASIHHTVTAAESGDRLDRIVARAAGVSRRIARTWIAEGRVRVGAKPMRVLSRTLAAGRRISIEPPDDPGRQTSDGTREGPRLPILHIDRHLVIVDKPAGLLSERDRFGAPSVEDVLPAMLAEQRTGTKIWLVHRLDAATSGVLVLARRPGAAATLGQAFRDGTVHKRYLAICQGELDAAREVNAPIGREKGTRHAVRRDGKPSATQLEPLARHRGYSLVAAEPRTGRTHQIRVHLAHIGHPIVGDSLYGGPRYIAGPRGAPEAVPRTMLHAARLTLPHPKDGAPLTVEAAPPDDFAALAARLGLST